MNLGRGDYFFLFIFSNSIVTGQQEFVKLFPKFFLLDGAKESTGFPVQIPLWSFQTFSVWMNKPSSVGVIVTSNLTSFLPMEI
tara:strand:+ start:2581 stop:2829 length:249 start_codon:yes stop_codon:yes gene_type:complete